MQDTQTSRRGFLRTLAASGLAAPLVARAEEIEAAVSTSLRTVRLDDTSPESVRRLRDQYLLSPDLIYLNHASIGTVPLPVVRAHTSYIELCETHPSLYVWGSVWREVTEQTRSDAASLLSCRPDELAITHNTTEGFNILAHGLPIGRGDEVLFSSLNHPGASVAWHGLATQRGFSVRSFDFPLGRAADLNVDEVVALHLEQLRPETRVLVVPHVDNMIGMTHPLAELSAEAKAAGVEFVVVDGAQSAGMIPVDLSAADVDAYSMSPHKWIQAPKGLGLFWVSESLRDRLPRMWYRTGGSRIEQSSRKYEDYSTRAWPAVVALGDALRFQASIGEAEKQRRYRRLWTELHERVRAEGGLSWRSPVDPALRSMIVSVEVDGHAAPRLTSSLLAEHGINLRAFGPPLNTLRVAPNVATGDDEIERFFEVVTTLGD